LPPVGPFTGLIEETTGAAYEKKPAEAVWPPTEIEMARPSPWPGGILQVMVEWAKPEPTGKQVLLPMRTELAVPKF